MAAPDPIMTAGKPKNDRKAKPTLVEKDTSTWTWQNLSRFAPIDDRSKSMGNVLGAKMSRSSVLSPLKRQSTAFGLDASLHVIEDSIVKLAGLQRFAGDLIYGKASCPLPLVSRFLHAGMHANHMYPYYLIDI